MNDIEAFFADYSAAFEAREPRAIAALYAYPAHVVSDTGDAVHVVALPDAEAFQGPLTDVLALYGKVGCKQIHVRALDVEVLSSSLRRARVQWGLTGLAGLPLYDFTTSYVLVRQGPSWKAVSAVSHDEMAKYRAFIGR